MKIFCIMGVGAVGHLPPLNLLAVGYFRAASHVDIHANNPIFEYGIRAAADRI